jgi:serine/threonine-protein kinase
VDPHGAGAEAAGSGERVLAPSSHDETAARMSAPPEPAVRPRTAPPPRQVQTSMADLLLGTVLADRYKLVSKLGEGAMGWVFLAEHVEIGKRFAVKVLRPALCRLPEAVRRFRREARAATTVGSKHIVDVSDFGTTPNGAVFFAMEHLEGGEDLGTLLKREGPLEWKRVKGMLLQLCEALQAAHDAGIIHRDVKPANCYRMSSGGDPDFIKVLDFGIARLANPEGGDSIVTQTGVVMGTPDYMAPEQAQGLHVDHCADIYSLGATAYALLTGRPPFAGANEYEVIYKHLNEPPKPPSAVRPSASIPAWFDAAILRAMAKKPGDRFASMRELGEALRGEASASSSSRALGSMPAPEPSAAARRRKASGASPLVFVGGAVALALVGGLAYYLVFG